MNEFMVETYNNTVSPNDLLIHCGDFAMGGKENIPKFRKRLDFPIWIIKGNHDRNRQFMLDSGFEQVFDSLIYCHKSETESYDILLTHHPHSDMNELIPQGMGGSIKLKYAFHGHNHGIYKRNGVLYDVGVDAIGYIPKTVEEIIENG